MLYLQSQLTTSLKEHINKSIYTDFVGLFVSEAQQSTLHRSFFITNYIQKCVFFDKQLTGQCQSFLRRFHTVKYEICPVSNKSEVKLKASFMANRLESCTVVSLIYSLRYKTLRPALIRQSRRLAAKHKTNSNFQIYSSAMSRNASIISQHAHRKTSFWQLPIASLEILIIQNS